MKCLISSSCTKPVVTISSFIITLLGFASFIVSLAAFSSTVIFADKSIRYKIESLKYIMLLSGLALFFVGIFGICGSLKKNSLLLAIYGTSL